MSHLPRFATGHTQRGMVLVVVLWLLVLLTVLVATQATSSRVESELVRNRTAALQARSAAEAGLYTVLDLLAREQGESARTLRTDGGIYRMRYHGVELAISVLDEAGKIDLNDARPEMLRNLLISLSGDMERGRALTDAILDWRDLDSARREYGAEDDDYQELGLPYGAKDEYMDNLEELLLVQGMDSKLYAKLSGMVTVNTGAKGINPLVAQRRVLLTVPGVSMEQVEEYLRARERYFVEGQGQVPPLFPVSDRNYISRDRDQLYSIHIRAETTDGMTERIAVLTRVSARQAGDGGRPYEILSWDAMDYTATLSSPSAIFSEGNNE